MNGGKQAIQGIGPGNCVGAFTYFPNGTTSPVATSITGPLARFISTITYSATGVQTIVFTSDFRFANTPRFLCQPTCDSLATSFEVSPIDAYNTTTRTLVLQQRQATTGYAAAATADCHVTVFVFAQDTTGK